MGTIVVAGGLLLIVGAVITKLIRDKKQGKTCCSGNCAHCKGCRH